MIVHFFKKAAFIAVGSVQRCIETGDPMIKTSGLAEYGKVKCRRIGNAAGEAAEAVHRRYDQ